MRHPTGGHQGSVHIVSCICQEYSPAYSQTVAHVGHWPQCKTEKFTACYVFVFFYSSSQEGVAFLYRIKKKDASAYPIWPHSSYVPGAFQTLNLVHSLTCLQLSVFLYTLNWKPLRVRSQGTHPLRVSPIRSTE